MVWNIGDPGDQSLWLLEGWLRVLLCLAYRFCDVYVQTCNFGEIGNHGDRFL